MVRLLALATILCAAACGRPDAAAERAPGADTPAGGSVERVKGTPDGGLEDWIHDITTGLEGLERAAATDAQAAQRRALDLYVGRQEYIEMYWGEQGRLRPARLGEELAKAVTDAETSFHDVMQSLMGTALDTVQLGVQLDTLNVRMGRVLQLGRQSGAQLVPPGGMPGGGGT